MCTSSGTKALPFFVVSLLLNRWQYVFRTIGQIVNTDVLILDCMNKLEWKNKERTLSFRVLRKVLSAFLLCATRTLPVQNTWIIVFLHKKKGFFVCQAVFTLFCFSVNSKMARIAPLLLPFAEPAYTSFKNSQAFGFCRLNYKMSRFPEQSS